MRKIKFRAWDKESKSMRYGAEYTLMLCLTNPDVFELMEYIGIRDNNGVEVYEGDIVILDQEDIGGDTYQGEVVRCDDQTLSNLEWGLWLRGERQGYHSTNFLGKLEVIGNTHKNPELVTQ